MSPFRVSFLVLALLCLIAATFAGPAHSAAAADPPVTLVQTPETFVLDNGIVTVTIAKNNSTLLSMKYKGLEMLNGDGHSGSYWSHRPSASHVVDSVTLDPATTGGERAEVSIKSDYAGTAQGSGPGGSTACDIEVRYALGRGDSGVYTSSIFTHKAGYPATGIGEARFLARLNDDYFDWMTVDSRRNLKMLTAYDWNLGQRLNMKEARLLTTGIHKGEVEHKYDYCAVQFDTPAFGWSSTAKKVGLWFVNPSIEYLSGGPTKLELVAHRDATFVTTPTTPAPPCLLNYWRGSHYVGSECEMAAGETWSKVIGPFLVYCNSGGDANALYADAMAQAKREAAKWPYDWESDNRIDYPSSAQRGQVSGRIVLHDPQFPNATMSDLKVGLAPQDYETPRGTAVTWQNDAKFYQFWARAGSDGRFAIPAIRPGTYTLHAFATGVLGEYTGAAPVVVAPGGKIDLGDISWTPVRFGHQVWEIGVPDRTAGEFRHGDHYWQWGLYNEYLKDFPSDVHFTIGKSDPRTDWNYAQVPRASDNTGSGNGPGTTWTISFTLPDAPKGKATLRIAIAGCTAKEVAIGVNGQPAGTTGPLPDTATIRRDAIRGYWLERDVPFDASLLKAGENTLTLTIPAGNVMSGIQYDYLRLELE